MSQSNAVAAALEGQFGVPTWASGLGVALLTGGVILGGIGQVARVASLLVPFMILTYVAATVFIILQNASAVPGAFAAIFESAFSPAAAVGGFAGATLKSVIRTGLSRGLFSNESGLGSAPIAAAAAASYHPARQALVAMTQTFIDTLVVCTLTALALMVGSDWTSGLNGAALTLQAFERGLGAQAGGLLLTTAIATFAYSTVLGWSYYGEKAAQYAVGPRAVPFYRIVYCAATFAGAVWTLEDVWAFADLANGLMALPNLVALLLLSGKTLESTREYLGSHSGGK